MTTRIGTTSSTSGVEEGRADQRKALARCFAIAGSGLAGAGGAMAATLPQRSVIAAASRA